MPLAAGTKLGRYEIRSLIGSGGMGVVYLAEDVPLGRPVALKLLLDELTTSREHLRRFEREARATSALNHPNIITIHEIGHVEATHFIATEFVNGQTLRQYLRGATPGLAQVLDIVTQVAAGLAAAHEAGVTHRDLKPENIMIRGDGYVKVLDFGLAKLTEERFARAPADGDQTVTAFSSDSGTMAGTISYMSPEQLRGASIDSRTDVWSLGVVLYEMLAGHTPFGGESTADVIVSILEREPTPLPEDPRRCPEALRRVVARALTKEPQGRYQTVGEMLGDLRALKDAAGTISGAFDMPAGGAASPPARAPVAAEPPAGHGGEAGGLRELAREARNRPLVSLGVAAALVVALFALGALAALALALLLVLAANLALLARRPAAGRARQGGTPVTFQSVSLSRLTNIGRVTDAIISPDGKYAAYVRDVGGKHSLWVRQVATTVNLQIVPPADVTYSGLTFSPDGDYIYYVIYENANQRLYFLYQVPVLGGVSKKVLDDVDTPITFSPDGRRFAFVRGYPSLQETVLIVANADGTEERRLATRKTQDFFGWRGGPAWSPDGRTIASAVGVYDVSMGIVGVSTDDGAMRPLTPRRWPWVGRVAWLPDGGVAVIARDEASGFSQIWSVSQPGGDVSKITNDLNDYQGRALSVSSDAKSLVAVQTDYLSGIWVVPAGQPGQARQLTAGRADGFYGLSWTPDGRIVYASKASGSQDIWIMGADGGGQTQLTFKAGSNYHPCVTADGRHIVFISTRSGAPDIWRMDLEGRNPTRLTQGSVPGWPQCTPDGRWLMYKAMGWGKRSLFKMPVEGGGPALASDSYVGCFAISPDGERIACEYWDESLTSQLCLAVMPAEGGVPEKLFANQSTLATSNYISNVIRWTAAGDAVTFVDNRDGVSNLWNQPVGGGEPEQVTNFKNDQVFWFDWSRDGAWLACARGVVTRDVVLVTLSS